MCIRYIYNVNKSEQFYFPDRFYGKWYYTLWITSLFWLISLIEIKNELYRKIISVISSNTVVVYLGHLPILVYHTSRYPLKSPISASLTVVLLFIGCEILAEIMKRLPLLRKLI